MIDLKKWSRSRAKQAGARLLEVADRVDERGGEIRDQLKEKVSDSKRLARWKKVLDVATPGGPAQVAPTHPGLSHHKASSVFSYGDARKQAQVFCARSCPWSGRAMRLFDSAGIDAVYLDLDHQGSGPLKEQLQAETGQLTVPFIYLRGQFIGGFNALDEIHRLGQLPYYVLDEAERRKHPDHGKIEIAPRASNVDALYRPPE